MRARSWFAALAIGLAISCRPNQSIAQAGEVEELHQRILALDSIDQTFEAIPLAKEYAAAIEKKSGSDTAAYAVALDILVDLHVKLNRFSEAEPFARRSLAIREGLSAADQVEVARNLNNLAFVLENQSKYEEAQHLVRRSLAMREQALGPNHVRVADSVNNLGVLLVRQGKSSEAERYFRRALEILDAAGEKDEGRIAGVLSGLASTLEVQQRSAESEPLYRRALALTEPLLKQERALRDKRKSDSTAPMPPSKLGNSNYFFSNGRNWASLLAGMRLRTAGHAANFREMALERGDRLMGNLHIARIEYRALIQAAYRMGAHERSFQEEAFLNAQWVLMNEAARAVSQLQARFGSGTGELADLVRQRQDLLGRRRDADTRLVDMLMGRAEDIGEDGKSALRQTIATLDKDLDAIEARLGGDFPEYAALAHPEPLSIAATQDLLRPDEVLVQFIEANKWLQDDRTPPEEAFAWFISKSEIRWIKIPYGPVALTEKVRALRCGLDASAWDIDGSQCGELWPAWQSATGGKRRSGLPFDTQRAYELYRMLFAGAEDIIRGKQLLIVPSPSLSILPLHVLVTEPPAAAIPTDVGAYRHVAWFASRFPITVLPSVASLKALRQFVKTSHATNPYIGLGDPLLAGSDGKDLRAWGKQTCPRAPVRLGSAVTGSVINRSAHTFFRGSEARSRGLQLLFVSHEVGKGAHTL